MREEKTQYPVYAARSAFRQTGVIFKNAAKWAWQKKWYYLGALVVSLPLLYFCMRFDPAITNAVTASQNKTLYDLASTLGRIGKTDGVTLWLSVILIAGGYAFKRKRMRITGICVVLAVITSGIGVNVLRPAFGRARPYSENAGSFHPFNIDHQYNSFPSGHSSEAWTVATVVIVAYPPAAIPAAAYALSMQWARIKHGQHYPVDVMAGMLWGVACAIPFAMQCRKKKLEA